MQHRRKVALVTSARTSTRLPRQPRTLRLPLDNKSKLAYDINKNPGIAPRHQQEHRPAAASQTARSSSWYQQKHGSSASARPSSSQNWQEHRLAASGRTSTHPVCNPERQQARRISKTVDRICLRARGMRRNIDPRHQPNNRRANAFEQVG